MKIVQINSCNFGSTGKIMIGIAGKALNCGNEVYMAIPNSRSNKRISVDNTVLIGDSLTRNLHLKLAQLTGFNGCFSICATYRFLKQLDKLKPDVLHLHNLHNCYINLPMLFNYIKKKNIPVVWTLHDCWSFTGQCAHFEMIECDKWKNGCHHCQQYKSYPQCYVDRTKTMWKLKKKWFAGVKNMTIVTPSRWLADLVKQSFLSEYSVRVINNGIDLSVFKPTESDFKQSYNIADKYIVLGVAFGWGRRKGLDIFIDLAKRLDKKYQIILVGTDDNVDKLLPENIISIHRTHNQEELAKIYTAADIFFNPTREDNYPTVNMEAIACGTPVITFNTGGSPEMVDENTGIVIPQNDIDKAERTIKMVCEKKPFTKEMCMKKAQSFDMNDRFKEYINLYELI